MRTGRAHFEGGLFLVMHISVFPSKLCGVAGGLELEA